MACLCLGWRWLILKILKSKAIANCKDEDEMRMPKVVWLLHKYYRESVEMFELRQLQVFVELKLENNVFYFAAMDCATSHVFGSNTTKMW
ncbi:hypothetical protein GBA52_022082 [Prunus armeniaca]|nr:hypothetical protein GBA52_022082 [Prunus armeniaca]